MKTVLQALLRAQNDILDPVKNKSNPAFKSKYADLGAVLDACKEPLAKHGLLLVQTIEMTELRPVLLTRIYHAESGECIESRYPLPSEGTPQQLGSAISYSKRYSIMAMLAMQSEDDDGNAASAKPDPSSQVPLNDALLQTAQKKLSEAKTVAEIERVLKLTESLPAAQKEIIQTAAASARGRIGNKI